MGAFGLEGEWLGPFHTQFGIFVLFWKDDPTPKSQIKEVCPTFGIKWFHVIHMHIHVGDDDKTFMMTFDFRFCGLLFYTIFIPIWLGMSSGQCMGSSVQDWSLQCPSNAIWPFKIYLSQHNPSKRNPKLKMKTSLEVLNIICMSQEPTSIGHCNYKKWS